MNKSLKALINIIWIFDVLNFPFMEFLDTTIPINTLAWFLIFMFLPTSSEE